MNSWIRPPRPDPDEPAATTTASTITLYTIQNAGTVQCPAFFDNKLSDCPRALQNSSLISLRTEMLCRIFLLMS